MDDLMDEYKGVNEAFLQIIENRTKALEIEMAKIGKNLACGSEEVMENIATGLNEIFQSNSFRIIFIGGTKVGKSSIINRVRGIDSESDDPDRAIEGFGGNDTTKDVQEFSFNGSKLKILDTPGHSGDYVRTPEEFRNNIVGIG